MFSRLGLPTSSSHALIGGLVGSAVVQFNGLRKILEAMILSPLFGFGMGFLIMALVSWIYFRVHRGVATKIFSRFQSCRRVSWPLAMARTTLRK
jgi:PiT family inorganic phosphate transporter